MKYLILLIAAALAVSCSSSSSNPVLTSVSAAICDVETSITGDFGASIVSACGGAASANAACGAAFQAALGNANLCGQPGVAQITTAQIASAKAARMSTKTAGALNNKAVIGNIACPLAIGAAMGVLTTQIPTACGCTQSLSASSLDSTLVSICEAAVPI